MACNEKPIKSSTIARESNIRILSSYNSINSIKTFFEIVFPTHYNHRLPHFYYIINSLFFQAKYSTCVECEIIFLRKLWNIAPLSQCEMKFAHIRVSEYFTFAKQIFHSEAISLARRANFVEKSTCFRLVLIRMFTNFGRELVFSADLCYNMFWNEHREPSPVFPRAWLIILKG